MQADEAETDSTLAVPTPRVRCRWHLHVAADGLRDDPYGALRSIEVLAHGFGVEHFMAALQQAINMEAAQ